jgi:hypothetical protein
LTYVSKYVIFTENFTDLFEEDFMSDDIRTTILKTLETIYELQLTSIRQLLGEEDIQTHRRIKKGVRRQSLVDSCVDILTSENRPLHVNELVKLLRDHYGRITERDTISSALAKKARQNILIKQTGPATFSLRNDENK